MVPDIAMREVAAGETPATETVASASGNQTRALRGRPTARLVTVTVTSRAAR
jgi:hypothetical protein